ncbi:glutamine-hydrolyzing carbamoyl-phosphate synthase small subunit [Candidatus Curtissbacteria bacterium]|nr:glutamine-hydrolyzing carbamoyl-phosphate synthase small subunit [Candidatus Curtissbacteria bacterium]
MAVAKLILEDGTTTTGQLFGAPISVSGEVVFATGMVGYDMSMTDPSYAGQILVFTYPLIGNWGVPKEKYWESSKVHTKAIIVGDLTTAPNHWQMQQTLDAWARSQGVPILSGIDTRALAQKLRDHGVMLGKIVASHDLKFEDPNKRNLVAEVSVAKLQIHKPKNIKYKIGLLNCGSKRNILNSLLKRDAMVYEMPWDYDPFTNKLELDGLLISNGPGDPKMADKSIAIVKKSMEAKLPTFGVCLGNQLLALAAGGDTYKLKFGHRSQNQPTIEIGTNRCYITTQNHGFAVDEKKLPKGFKPWFTNANDGTNEGIKHEKLPFFTIQFHPEATPGPTDTLWLFDYFLERVRNG